MNAKAFVCASAILFTTWLTLTYVREVSPKHYPSLGKGSVPVSAQKTPPSPNPTISQGSALPLPIARQESGVGLPLGH